MKYRHIACGGTFDFFHAGHREFLKKAFLLSKKVSIGITTDSFANSLGKYPFNNFDQRKSEIQQFLKEKGHTPNAVILKLNDIYGSTIADNSLQGVLVTENSRKGALRINALRNRANLNPIDVIMSKLKKATDDLPISSTRIKNGEISPDGENYFELLKAQNFVLPKKMRSALAKPFGEVVQEIGVKSGDDLLITVGDQTTYDALRQGLIPKVSIIDCKVQRIRAFESYKDLGFDPSIRVLQVRNPQGSVTIDLSKAVFEGISNNTSSVIVVDGEEDLAVLPSVLLAPLGTNLYYGIRNHGLVKVIVDIECKRIFLELLGKFSKR